jgi:hypothetical protein
MDNSIDTWKPSGPSLGRCDIAGDRRRATFGKLRRSGVGSRQTADIMSAPDEFSHHAEPIEPVPPKTKTRTSRLPNLMVA